MAAIDILISSGPQLKFYWHLNYVYLLLDLNETCMYGQDYDHIELVLVSYEKTSTGEIDRTRPIESISYRYRRYDLLTRYTPDGFPPYNLRFPIQNYWYEINLQFTFQYNNSPSGSNIFPSKITKYYLDNNLVTVYGQKITRFIKGKLKENLEKNMVINIWVDPDLENPDPRIQLGDIILNPAGNIVFQAIEINDNYIRINKAEKNFIDMVQYLSNNSDFRESVKTFFHNLIPTDGELKIKILYNGLYFYLIYNGDLSFLEPQNILITRTIKDNHVTRI